MVITAYRGQHGQAGENIHTRLPSISFGSFEAAKLYANIPNNRKDTVNKPTVLKAEICIDNPIIDNRLDCFADFDELAQKLGKEFMWDMAEKKRYFIYETNNWQENYPKYHDMKELRREKPEELLKLYIDAYILLDDEEFVDRAKSLGFDGAIHIGNGETCDELEYKIFSKNQIKQIEEIL